MFKVSGKSGVGLSDLGAFLENKTTIFVGKSGSGKSTISSKLLDINLKTKELNKSKGVHTTSGIFFIC
jgi:putative ribosome biogenesis GTPase RsgA